MINTAPQALDIFNADHSDMLVSTAQGQSTKNEFRTRRTPVSWGVVCLIHQIQSEHAAAMDRQSRQAN